MVGQWQAGCGSMITSATAFQEVQDSA